MRKTSSANSPEDYNNLKKLFSGKILREISKNEHSPTLYKTLKNSDYVDLNENLVDVTKDLFSRLVKEYRSEYVYRVAITKKIFLGRHSPNSTVLIPELRVGLSRADLVMVNGTTTAFEIKSDLDSIERLGNQVHDYLKSFDLVYLVTSKDIAEKAERIIPETVGIISLSKNYTLQTVRKATSNAENIDIQAASTLLRIEELKKITKEITGKTLNSPNIKIRRDCLKELDSTSPNIFHRSLTKALKSRFQQSKENFEPIPDWLLPAFIESGVKSSEWKNLKNKLLKHSIKSFMEEPCQYTSHTSEQKLMK